MSRLALFVALPCLLAAPAVRADTHCSVWYRLTDGNYENRTVNANAAGTPDARVSLDALGPGCWMEAQEDRCILHLSNAAFDGAISAGGRLDIRLEGRNGVVWREPPKWGGQIALNAGNLSISGPGTLKIVQIGGGTAVNVSSLDVSGDATVDVTATDGTNGACSDASCVGAYTHVRVRNASLLVRNFCTGTIYGASGAGINCVDFEASSATVSALANGTGIRVSQWSTPAARTGGFVVKSSCVHALSLKNAAGIRYETSGRAEGTMFEVSDSVLCAHGGVGLSLAGAHSGAAASLVRVSGSVTGKKAGVRCDVPLSFAGSKLLIAGNLYGEEEPVWYGDVGASALFKGEISGPFVQKSGETTLLAPKGIALQVPEFVLKGGTVNIAPRVGRDDVLKIWSADFATRELRALVGVSLGADATTLLTDENGIADLAARVVFTDNAYLFHRNLSDPLVGVRSQSVRIEDGILKVENATQAGIHLCWPREGDGALTMSGGTLDVRGEAVGLQSYRAEKGMLGWGPLSDKTDRGFFLSGGTATVSAGANAILLRSFLRQTGGNLTVRVDGEPGEIEETKAYPFYRGCALFAAGGFAKTAGSFRAESGILKTAPESVEP